MSACSGATSATSSSSATSSIPPSNSEVLSSVKVEDKGAGAAPGVTFDKPLAIKAESMRVVKDGTGARLVDGQSIEFRTVSIDAEKGDTIGENFTQPAGASVVLDEKFKAQFPMVYTTFLTAKVGAFIAYGTPALPAVAATASAPAQPAQPANVSVFQVTAAKDPAKLMSADDVAALAKNGGLPTATFDDKGIPSISIPKKDPPAGLAVQVLTEGKGEVVKDSDSISAYYTGWAWSDSKKFDSSFDKGAPLTFSLQGVIPGWTMGLAGQKVGSTVLLSIPSSLAYGDTPSAGKPAGALVFVVKIDAKK